MELYSYTTKNRVGVLKPGENFGILNYSLRLLNENLSFIFLDDVSICVDFLSFDLSTADEELLSEMAIQYIKIYDSWSSHVL